MIGLATRFLPGGEMLICCAALVALFALCGCAAGARCRIRKCRTVRRCFRCLGKDKFVDFEVVFIVQEAVMYSTQKLNSCVRFTAGDQQVCTDVDEHGKFFQPLSLLVEQ